MPPKNFEILRQKHLDSLDGIEDGLAVLAIDGSEAGHAAGSDKGVRRKTFHNNRFPLLSELLQSHGWVEAAEGEVADVSFYSEPQWEKEWSSKYKGRLALFSRAFTDLMSNKKTCHIGLQEGGCADLVPQTFVDLKEWKETEGSNEQSGLWFFKQKNSSNSQGIGVTSSVDGSRQILALAVHSAGNAERSKALSAFDDDFFETMRQHLMRQGQHSPPSKEAMRLAFCDTLLSKAPEDKVKTATANLVIQRAVERPLLICGGRKFALRIYVLALLKPQSAESDSASCKRQAELYVSESAIARPQQLPYDTSNTSPGCQFEDSSTLYASVADGSEYAASRWVETQFPRIKESARRILSSFPLFDEPTMQPRYSETMVFQKHFGVYPAHTHPTPGSLPPVAGRFGIFGLDYMLDENDVPWLLEINGICNLRTTPTCQLDVLNKTQLAKALYDMLIAPAVDGTAPVVCKHLHRLF